MFQKLAILAVTLISLAACQTKPVDYTGAGSMRGEVVPGSQQDLEVNVGDRVLFPFDSSALTMEAQSILTRQAAWLKANPAVSVTIEGHADERGTREYNLGLGERRANAAKNFLVSAGIHHTKISTISYGKERPAIIGSGEEVWSQNRRSVTVVNQ